MKIFAVYAKVELAKKPDWLDDFRNKYDELYEYHVTLKQPCLVEESRVPEIKDKLHSLFSNLKILDHKIVLSFDSLNIAREVPDEIDIMIKAAENNEIRELQKNVLVALHEYSKYVDIKHKAYEENFTPHITIGRNLNEQSYATASKELIRDYICEGVITKVILGVVDNDTVAEANDPNNQTIYNL